MSNNKLVLVAVLAHPDDETFGMGGTLALYAQRGVDVHLVCATRGEAGEVDPDYLEGFTSIAERRVAELRCAAGILGLAGIHFLDYRDSGMLGSPNNLHPQALVAQPVEAVAGRVACLLRLLKPQVVVTFDQLGGYKHPDHIAVHKATVRAFQLAGDPSFIGIADDCVASKYEISTQQLPIWQPQKLYYQVFPKGLLRAAVRVLPLFGKDPHRFGRNGDIDLVDLVEGGSFPTHAYINVSSVQAQRDAATACHASQLAGAGLRRGPLSHLTRWFNRHEQYMRAIPVAEKGLKEKDLFAGID